MVFCTCTCHSCIHWKFQICHYSPLLKEFISTFVINVLVSYLSGKIFTGIKQLPTWISNFDRIWIKLLPRLLWYNFYSAIWSNLKKKQPLLRFDHILSWNKSTTKFGLYQLYRHVYVNVTKSINMIRLHLSKTNCWCK